MDFINYIKATKFQFYENSITLTLFKSREYIKKSVKETTKYKFINISKYLQIIFYFSIK